jgi:predicted acylesterase/phospholipase RssA
MDEKSEVSDTSSEASEASETFEALCVSAGGIKGFCALGALQYMQDSHLIDVNTVKHFSGTSIGSCITLFLAIGYTPIELMVYFSTHNVFDQARVKKFEEIFSTESVFDYTPIHQEFEKMCIAKLQYVPTFQQLFENFGVKLVVATYNLSSMKPVYLSYCTHPNLSCVDAIRMSSTLPFLFSSCTVNEHEYIDGGFIDEFPIEQLPFIDHKTVGIYLNDVDVVDKPRGKLQNMTCKIIKIISIASRELHALKLERLKSKVDIISIDVEDVPVYRFDLSKGQRLDLFSLGYNTAKTYFEEFKNVASTSTNTTQ